MDDYLAKAQAMNTETEYMPRASGFGMIGSGGLAAASSRTPELVRVNDRLAKLLDGLGECAARLHMHADRLKGELPQVAEKTPPRPVRSGAFGATEDILDCLDETMSRLNGGIDRNTTLA